MLPEQELQAQVAQQAAALDLSQAEARARGVAALPAVLWRGGAPVQAFPRLGMDRAAYLRELLPHLTAAEQARPHGLFWRCCAGSRSLLKGRPCWCGDVQRCLSWCLLQQACNDASRGVHAAKLASTRLCHPTGTRGKPCGAPGPQHRCMGRPERPGLSLQVALYNGVPREAVPERERYAAAMACIAEGVTAQKPALVAAAQRQLAELRAAATLDARSLTPPPCPPPLQYHYAARVRGNEAAKVWDAASGANFTTIQPTFIASAVVYDRDAGGAAFCCHFSDRQIVEWGEAELSWGVDPSEKACF